MTGITSKPAYGETIGAAASDGRVLLSDSMQTFVDELVQLLNARVLGDALLLPAVTVATVPAAASWGGGLVYVSDESGGAVPAFSDGTNWRRVTDRAVIS